MRPRFVTGLLRFRKAGFLLAAEAIPRPGRPAFDRLEK
ncbi:hypothetical protein CES85_0332 [Ochrobactrum quorumnocens]|uniref:Uncharacterized protein n=1 Tax=Ochrobactrum quorumnocens TaxID=271865 RepID=A0A248UFI9_9HYPH|nr:hypothetical protein CES85_0332 [[Ochrobactrum] quorumnocens]